MKDSRRHRGGPSRIGSLLVAVGCLGVLGVTYMVGFYVGRYWTRSTLLTGIPDMARGLPAQRPIPALTFYEELKAPQPRRVPLTKAAPAEQRRAVERASSPLPAPEDRAGSKARRPSDAPAPQGESVPVGSRFTVQVAAYSARASAEALRNAINASGHEAYIVESNNPPGSPRYRVRVGSYPSREAAVSAAARLPVPGGRYVTTR